jgi:hypothetical protein
VKNSSNKQRKNTKGNYKKQDDEETGQRGK